MILMTAHATPDIESEAQALGVDVILHKPVRLARLDDAVHELLPEGASKTP